MEDLIYRNSSSALAQLRSGTFRQLTEVTCAVPLYSAGSFSSSSLPGYSDLEEVAETTSTSVTVIVDHGAEQDKLPSYSEAMEGLNLKSHKTVASYSDPPPSYNEAVDCS
jgi:hypothetical protein